MDYFSQYLIKLYNEVPSEVYEGLLSLFCVGGSVIIAYFGFKRGWRIVAGLLLVEYIFLVLCSTVLFRMNMITQDHDFSLFWSYAAIKNGRENLLAGNIMNIVVFLPIGTLQGMSMRKLKWRGVLLVGLLLSVSIEMMQYYFRRGFAEVDDVICCFF